MMDTITTRGMTFRDQSGRQRLFNGINLVHKGTPLPGGGKDYTLPWDDADLAQLAGWGFNLVRLGVIWDALEPQPGVYNESYLAQVGQILDSCAQNGIYAILDMHQDLYSTLYSDGAPAWATITDAPYDATSLWSDAYLESAAVQQAFDFFWANAPAPDGVGLRDHFTALWALLANRFGGHPALLGYDILNEPFPGTQGLEIFGTLMAALAQLRSQATGKVVTAEDMLAIFENPAAKLEALGWLEDKAFYQTLAQAAQPPAAAFENQVLDPFYARVAGAIRGVTSKGIILRENGYFSNMGIPCAAQPVVVGGAREPQQAYAPHGYDLVVDTEALSLASDARVDVIFEAHRAAQERLDVPVIVGEWGAFGGNGDILGHARHILGLFEQYQWSHTYWCYTADFAQAPVLSVLRRAYPRAVAGDLLDYANDDTATSFSMRWREPAGSTAATELYLPAAPREVNLDGTYTLSGQRLVIPPISGERSLTIRF
ncbi:MAG: cellulase family glycosylhydrolase [Anaerolineae bacterium]